VGDVTFGADGQWAEARLLWVQFANIRGSDLRQFKGKAMEVIPAAARLQIGRHRLALRRGAALEGHRRAKELSHG
jgi:hypothetical protein